MGSPVRLGDATKTRLGTGEVQRSSPVWKRDARAGAPGTGLLGQVWPWHASRNLDHGIALKYER